MGLDSVLLGYSFEPCSAIEVYGSIFRLGEGFIQKRDEQAGMFKANPIIYMKNDSSSKGQYRILFEDEFQEVLEESYAFDFAITNGLTYFGRKMTIDKASKMYAMWLDVDGLTDKSLGNFLYGAGNSFEEAIYPRPNFITLSGHNAHFCYVFREPLNLYPNVKLQLKQFKYGLLRTIWNPYTSNIETVQYQGINQGFRPIGGKTKIEGVKVRAFRTNQPYWTIEELNKFIPSEYRVDLEEHFKQTTIDFATAEKLYPEWIASLKDEKPRGYWHVNRNLYEWAKRKVLEGALYHHRYFCIMFLAMCGAKCSFYDEKKNPNPVTLEEVKRDVAKIRPRLDMCNPQDPVTDADISSALECFDTSYVLFPRETIEKLTAIPMPPQKRNFRKQDTHLQIARATKGILKLTGDLKQDGRPNKRALIQDYSRTHPEANHSQIAKALGVSRPTVIKWLKEIGR